MTPAGSTDDDACQAGAYGGTKTTEECASCRITGTLTCCGVAAYSFVEVRACADEHA